MRGGTKLTLLPPLVTSRAPKPPQIPQKSPLRSWAHARSGGWGRQLGRGPSSSLPAPSLPASPELFGDPPKTPPGLSPAGLRAPFPAQLPGLRRSPLPQRRRLSPLSSPLSLPCGQRGAARSPGGGCRGGARCSAPGSGLSFVPAGPQQPRSPPHPQPQPSAGLRCARMARREGGREGGKEEGGGFLGGSGGAGGGRGSATRGRVTCVRVSRGRAAAPGPAEPPAAGGGGGDKKPS